MTAEWEAPDAGSERLGLDYDENPERFRTARAVWKDHGLASDVHEDVARRFIDEGIDTILDIGCGDGELARALAGSSVQWVGLDLSLTMLADAPRRAACGDAGRLPFGDNTFGGAAALYVLYHLVEPSVALAEAYRVLGPGGLLAVAAPSRYDSPEIEEFLPRGAPPTFDAEIAPDLMRQFFPEIEVDAWDVPLLDLPDAEGVRRYLIGRGLNADSAAEAGRMVRTPLLVTKRGALVYGRKPARRP